MKSKIWVAGFIQKRKNKIKIATYIKSRVSVMYSA